MTGGLVHDRYADVILQPEANAGGISDNRHANAPQVVGRADSGEPEHLGVPRRAGDNTTSRAARSVAVSAPRRNDTRYCECRGSISTRRTCAPVNTRTRPERAAAAR